MSEHIRGSYDDALYKSTYTLLYFTVCKQLSQQTTVSKATGRHLDFGLLLTSITVAEDFYKHTRLIFCTKDHHYHNVNE